MLSDDLGLKLLLDYAQAIKLETLGRVREWAQEKKKEMESKRPIGQHPSWDPPHWKQMIEMIDSLAEERKSG